MSRDPQPHRRRAAALGAALLLLGTAACSGDDGDGGDGGDVPAGTEVLPQFEFDGPRHRPGRLTYDPVPPAHGYHSGLGWLRCDAYREPVPAELAVHSLEHGAVWITYDPELPARDVARLEDLRSVDQEYVLVSPYEGLPTAVVATAWGRQLRVDDAGDERLRAFTEDYAGNGFGDEKGAPCRGDGLDPETGEAALAAEAASPAPG